MKRVRKDNVEKPIEDSLIADYISAGWTEVSKTEIRNKAEKVLTGSKERKEDGLRI